jgi:hypothetical protein
LRNSLGRNFPSAILMSEKDTTFGEISDSTCHVGIVVAVHHFNSSLNRGCAVSQRRTGTARVITPVFLHLEGANSVKSANCVVTTVTVR